jgi:hypothetical protein
MNLELLCDIISKMEKKHHIEILHIITKYPSIQLNQNTNGFYFCIDHFPQATVEEIQKYVFYVSEQETTLNLIESQKQEIKRNFFTKT